VLEFLRLWYADWKALMSGGVSIFFALLGFAAEPASYKGLYLGVAVLSFVYGSFRVWRTERAALLKKQAELDKEREKGARPDVGVEIQEVYAEYKVREDGVPPNHLDEYFTLRVHLVNKGRPIAVRRFELHVNYDKGVRVTSTTTFDHLAFEYKRTVAPKESLYFSKTETTQEPLTELSRNLIPSGGGREGWLRFVLREVSNEQLEGIQGVTLRVVDVESNVHKDTAAKNQWRQTGKLINTYQQEFQRELERIEAEEKAKRKQIYNYLDYLIKEGRKIEGYKAENPLLYEANRPQWRGMAYEYLQGVGRTYLERFKKSDLNNDIATLEEIQKELSTD
jgi:hypothetical protein